MILIELSYHTHIDALGCTLILSVYTYKRKDDIVKRWGD